MKFQDFEIHLSRLIPDYQTSRYLLAVSGGVDSMVLLRLFKQHQLSFQVAFCHFGLRPEADQEEILLEKTCEKLDIKLHKQRFDTTAYSQSKKIGTQEAARELRYNFFNELLNTEKLDFIVTAHHANDNLETALYKLSKGTGIKGVRGIKPISDSLLRPLLPFSKSEIYDFAKENNIEWLEDKSNRSNKYNRNHIRNNVVTLLEKVNPSIEKSFYRTSQKLLTVENIYQNHITTLRSKLLKKREENFELKKTDLSEFRVDAYQLEDILEDFGIAISDCLDVMEKLDTHGQTYNSKDYKYLLLNERNHLILTRGEIKNEIAKKWFLNDKTLSLPNYQISVETINIEDFKLIKSPLHLYMDADLIEDDFLIRNWIKGDSFRPFGMKGSQKISDLLINKKLSTFEKQNRLVLEYKNQIVWVIGLRTSNLYSVTPSTKSVLHIYVEKHF